MFSLGFSGGAILWIVGGFPRRTVPSVPVVAVVGSRRIDQTEIRVALPDPPRWRCSTWSAGPILERAAGAPDVR